MVRLADFIRCSTEKLSNIYPQPEARNIVLMLCEEKLGVRPYTHIVEPDRTVPDGMVCELEDDLRRLLDSEPVQYVLGACEFYGRRFRLDRSVLIPRPETELLVREAVTKAMDMPGPVRVLDLCTGSGCIAWSILKEVQDASVVAVDISEDALALASGQFPGPGPEFLKADLLDEIPDALDRKNFDLIVSNPPYIMEKEKAAMRPNVLEWEPEIALFVPDEDPLLFYRAIARWSERLLVPGGYGMVEINETQGSGVKQIFEGCGFMDVCVIPDYFGKSRFVSFRR